ncbi:unnamed protein product [Schistocephalus solidus]|uniref:Endo/exonuclease/phosphatase domain-containing protein n=1 Tax=Schistocephalus solidus TaxID=70667 RepID=A0A183TSY4_SCHSO|nr:unnamed protein product [Schistocephalus solidus]
MAEKISDGIEASWLKIKTRGSQSLEVMTLFRPPKTDTDADTCLLENIKEMSSRPDGVLMGEFNALSIRWDDLQTQCSKLSFDHRLLNSTLEALLTQHVFVPTRARGGQPANCLDLVFTKDPDSIDEVHCFLHLVKVIMQYFHVIMVYSPCHLQKRKPGPIYGEETFAR